MAKNTKKAYFIGIAGNTMASLAIALKKNGWEVSGSDQKDVYPPITTLLDDHKIAYFKGYREENLSFTPDLVIVGRSALMVEAENPEYLKAQSLGCPVLSYPQVVARELIKKNSIVVAGTYGKSTTTALIAWILSQAGLDPSFMIGAVPLNFKEGLKITDSEYSVVEGDETPSLRETDPPKFMFYRPKFLLITATEYDHPEIYKTKIEYLDAYIELVKLLPDDGVLIYDQDSVDKRVIAACRCKKVPCSTLVNTFNNGVVFKESALRAAVLAKELKIDQKIIADSISSFMGLKGRNEFLGNFGGRFLYQDLSQQPSKVKGALSLLREKYPKNFIIAVFDPSASSIKYKENLDQYAESFDQADKILIGKVDFIKDVSGKNRVTGLDLVNAFGGSEKVIYLPVDENIIDFLKQNSKRGDILIFLSSGGLDFINLIEKIKRELK